MPPNQPKHDPLTIAAKLHFWARRYADGRMTGVVQEVNDMTEQLILQGATLQPETAGDNKGSIWAYDGDPNLCGAKNYEAKYGKDGKSVFDKKRTSITNENSRQFQDRKFET